MSRLFSLDALCARYWAVNATTLKPDPTVTDSEVNIGFGGLNGPLTYLSDIGMLLPLQHAGRAFGTSGSGDAIPAYISRCVATFDSLLAVPQRKQLFDLDMNILKLRGQLGDSEEVLGLTSTYHNLLRQWGE